MLASEINEGGDQISQKVDNSMAFDSRCWE